MSKKDTGITADKMNVKELKELAVSLKLVTEEEVKLLKGPAVLKIVKDWEKKSLVEQETLSSTPAQDKVTAVSSSFEEEKESEDTIGLFNGKKVLSRTKREINGKMYLDIVVESGETFTELA